MKTTPSSPRLDEFAFYANQLVNPLRGTKADALALAALNLATAGLIQANRPPLWVTLPFLLVAAGLLTRRLAYNAYGWAKQYRKNHASQGWERLDRQICVIGDSVVGLGTAGMSFGTGYTGYYAVQFAHSATLPAALITTSIAFGLNAVMHARHNHTIIKKDIGGVRNFIRYRSAHSIDTPKR